MSTDKFLMDNFKNILDIRKASDELNPSVSMKVIHEPLEKLV